MKKILIIDGSLRKGQTARSIAHFLEMIKGEYDLEVIRLCDITLERCRGCALCLSKGEEFCPLKDDRDMLLERMDRADAILFAVPNYALHVTSLMKNMFDRLAFVFHRPRFFNKVFSSIITQGVIGGKGIDRYFRDTAGFWGGHYVNGAVLTLPTGAYDASKPWKASEERDVIRYLKALSVRMRKLLSAANLPGPSLFRVLIFNVTRASHDAAKQDNRDYRYFKDKGWFSSDYYYGARIGGFKNMLGRLAGYLVKRLVAKTNK